jgi:pyruvate dehydrogenase (quinone)/pyruvate oxidase
MRWPVVAFAGDGGLTVLMEELATRAKYQLDVKVVAVKNNSLGQIKWEQMAFLGDPEFRCELQPIDFAGIANAYGIRDYSIEQPSICADILREAFSMPRPALIGVVVGADGPMPPKTTFEQTKNLAEAQAHDTPDVGKIARKLRSRSSTNRCDLYWRAEWPQ